MNDWQDAERHVERAHELYELGRWDEAESALREALSLNPYQSEWHFNLGLTLAASGRTADALGAFRQAHDLGEPTDTQAALETAAALLDLERPEEAVEWLELVLERDAESVDAHVQLIDACAVLSRHEDAELHFYLALQIEPESAAAHSAMAESLIDRREFDRAAWCLREASRFDPLLPRVFSRLAYTYALTGRYERARQLYLRELRNNPGDADAIVDLARLLIDMNRPAEASEKLRRALELVPDHADAHFALGEIADEAGDLDAARQHFGVVTKLDPGYPGARRRLARILIDLGRRGDEQAARVHARQELADLRRSVVANPDTGPDAGQDKVPDLTRVRDLTELLLDMGLYEDATIAARMLVDARRTDATSHHLLGVAQFASGRAGEGIESARRAVRLRPDFVAPMHNLAVAYLRRGELSRARYWVDLGLTHDHDDRGLRRLRAYLRVHAIRARFDAILLMFRGSRKG